MPTSGVAGRKAYKLPEQPILLKELILHCGINQAAVAEQADVSRTLLNLTLNRGYIPPQTKDFQKKIESYISKNQKAMFWLIERGLKPGDVWQVTDARIKKHSQPAGQGAKVALGLARGTRGFFLDDPRKFISKVEAEMIKREAMKQFKIFQDPFRNDVSEDRDIYMSPEHRDIEYAIIEVAKNPGFLAIIGEVGCGKSLIRTKAVGQLKRDGKIYVAYAEAHRVPSHDASTTNYYSRITIGGILDAIIMDTSEQKPKIKIEHKVRQAKKLLIDRSRLGYNHLLIIEEAHNLSPVVFKYLKQLYELQDGYKKLLGIVLIGQTELHDMLSEAQHPEMREVTRRIMKLEVGSLNGHIKEYLNFKFKRVGAELEKIFTPEAVEAIGARLTTRDGRNKKISHAYPLLVNIYAAKAVNMACEMGESKVTEDVVMAI